MDDDDNNSTKMKKKVFKKIYIYEWKKSFKYLIFNK